MIHRRCPASDGQLSWRVCGDSIPALGRFEEEARYNLHAANESLAAATGPLILGSEFPHQVITDPTEQSLFFVPPLFAVHLQL